MFCIFCDAKRRWFPIKFSYRYRCQTVECSSVQFICMRTRSPEQWMWFNWFLWLPPAHINFFNILWVSIHNKLTSTRVHLYMKSAWRSNPNRYRYRRCEQYVENQFKDRQLSVRGTMTTTLCGRSCMRNNLEAWTINEYMSIVMAADWEQNHAAVS